MNNPRAGDWAAVAGDPEPAMAPCGFCWAGECDRCQACQWFEVPDSPTPSLRRWIVFVGIGLALATAVLVWAIHTAPERELGATPWSPLAMDRHDGGAV